MDEELSGSPGIGKAGKAPDADLVTFRGVQKRLHVVDACTSLHSLQLYGVLLRAGSRLIPSRLKRLGSVTSETADTAWVVSQLCIGGNSCLQHMRSLCYYS